VLAERVEYLDDDGKLVTESLRDYSRASHPQPFTPAWTNSSSAGRRRRAQGRPLIDELAAEGCCSSRCSEEVGKDLDPFDLICHIAFDQPPLTRPRARQQREEARRVSPNTVAAGPRRARSAARKVPDEGVGGLDNVKMLEIALQYAMGTPIQLLKPFGGSPRASRAPSTNCKPPCMPGKRLISRCPSVTTRQIHPGHHAPGHGVDGDAQRISQLCWMFFLKIIDDQDQELELMQERLPLTHPRAVPVAHLGRRPRRHHRRRPAGTFINDELFPTLKDLPGAGQDGRRRVVRMCSRTPTTT
jgi:hypothetical protein